MTIVEYGKEHDDTLILLHGGGLSWWNYRETAEFLKSKYHIVIPILDGHSGSDKIFSSIEDNAKALIEYIDKVYGGFVTLIAGVSLGGQILAEILALRSDICQFAIIESALMIPMKLTQALVKPLIGISFGLIKYQWFSRLQFKSLKIKAELFNEYYRDSCNITKENMIAFLQANACYSIKESLNRVCAKVFICVGEKEPAKIIRSAYRLKESISGSNMLIMKNMHHGEFSLNHAEEYANMLINILEQH